MQFLMKKKPKKLNRKYICTFISFLFVFCFTPSPLSMHADLYYRSDNISRNDNDKKSACEFYLDMYNRVYQNC